MKIRAIHKQTGEVRHGDTRDSRSCYYTLDKRLWTFEKNEDSAESKDEPA